MRAEAAAASSGKGGSFDDSLGIMSSLQPSPVLQGEQGCMAPQLAFDACKLPPRHRLQAQCCRNRASSTSLWDSTALRWTAKLIHSADAPAHVICWSELCILTPVLG